LIPLADPKSVDGWRGRSPSTAHLERPMSLENLKLALPDYAKDVRLNLGSLATEPTLSDEQRAGTFIAAASLSGKIQCS
jgi:hypothetical protein